MNELKDYTIAMEQYDPQTSKTKRWYETVQGMPFPILGWEEFQFFKRIEDGTLIISEVTTGLRCGDDYFSELEAHEDVQRRLEKKGRDAVRKEVAEYQIPKSAVILHKD